MCRMMVRSPPASMRDGGAMGLAMPMTGLWSKCGLGEPPALADSANPS